MFDAMKFNGEVLKVSEFATSIKCKELVEVYPVEVRYDSSGDVEYAISTDPAGKLLVYRDPDNAIHSVYIGNDVETSCLVDLL